MNKLLYYPGFEIKDINWIKFSLLYIEELNSIVPIEGDTVLSDIYRKLRAETNLIGLYRPEFREGSEASREAITYVKSIIDYPALYGIDQSEIERWRDSQTHNYTLWRGKYHVYWKDFCTENRFGSYSPRGLKLPKKLACIYMTFLAQYIADFSGISPITDYVELDEIFMRSKQIETTSSEKIDLVKGIIELKLPVDIEDIGIDKIIEFRNRPDFLERLREFHKSIEAYMSSIENWEGLPERDYLHSLGHPIRDFTDEIVSIGKDALPVALGAYLLAKGITNSSVDKANVLVGGIGFGIGAVFSMTKAWSNTKPKRYTRKFVADLASLSE